MPITVSLEKEDGESVEQVADIGGALHRLIPNSDDMSYQMLRFIDWYGDTVFNHLQMSTLLSDLARLRQVALSAEDLAFVHRVESMARRCIDEGDLYLKFLGD